MCEENINCTTHPEQVDYMTIPCPMLTENDTILISSLEDWFSNIIPAVLCSFGSGLNMLLAIAIIKLQRLKHDVYQLLLVVLLSADSMYLILRIVDISKRLFSMTPSAATFIGEVVLASLQRFAASCSTFMIVAITMERFVVVHTPIR